MVALNPPPPIYGFLLVLNGIKWHNRGPLRDISLTNVSDLEFDLSGFLKVKSNGPSGLRPHI